MTSSERKLYILWLVHWQASGLGCVKMSESCPYAFSVTFWATRLWTFIHEFPSEIHPCGHCFVRSLKGQSNSKKRYSAFTTISNLDGKRSLVTTEACIAHACIWVSLSSINSMQCVWMWSCHLGEQKVTLCCRSKPLGGTARCTLYDKLDSIHLWLSTYILNWRCP